MSDRFPAPKGYESTPRARAYRMFRAAERLAKYLDRKQGGHTHTNRLEEMDWHENYWDDSCSSELGIYTGNWNEIDDYDRKLQRRETVPGGNWPRTLGDRLERLGAEVVWSDQHSVCDDCGKLIRTDADGFGWRPSFHVSHGSITCVGCLLDNIRGEEDVIEGCASIIWASVWAHVAEESDTYNLSGCEITEHMPEIPEEAYTFARKVLADMLHLNRREVGLQFNQETHKCERTYTARTVSDLLEMALRADICSGNEEIPHFDDYARRFGECMAFRAMGDGVGWEDDHAEVDGLEWSEALIGGQQHELEELAAESLGAVYSEHQSKWVSEEEAEAEKNATHYTYGSGSAGCMYDNGPHCAETLEDAIEGVLFIFEDDLSEEELEQARTNLREQHIHYFSDPGTAGADYCEVSEQSGPCPQDDE